MNNWIYYPSTTYRRAQYKKKENIVYLEGLVQNLQSTPNTVIGQLPLGFRPSSTVQVPITGQPNETAYSNKAIMLAITSDGRLSIQGYNLYNGVWISLSGVHFFID